MKKRILQTIFLISLVVMAHVKADAQFNNEWIDFNKTYYKFSVGSNGLYRIPFGTLQAAGLSSTPAEQFQLWRNGKEVSIYTSIQSGMLSGSDYIEFYGLMNDGKPDAVLYKDPAFQLADKWSLQTDTSAYFLTINPAPNARLVNTSNNVSSNTLSPEPYFMYMLSKNYKDQINPGYASIVGIYVYSSSYDNGEGWTSRNVQSNSPIVDQYNDLYVSSGGPDASIRVTAFGNTLSTRKVQVSVNANVLIDQPMDYFSGADRLVSFPSSLLGRAIDTIRISNSTSVSTDRMVVGKYELKYPRTFNFGGNSIFEFSLPGTSVGNYLVITNFSAGTVAPILYDLSNGLRFIADITVTGKYRFLLPPGGNRDFVLMSNASSAIKTIDLLKQKKFIDFSVAANQANYLIVSHPSMSISNNGDALDKYKLYRSSNAGGSYKVKIYDIDELVDQFAFGIKKHPLSVKNFLSYARQFFAQTPQYALLIGKGITYDQYRLNESKAVTERINIVPTFGNPGSDNILASADLDATADISIGRLSATTGDEVLAYLDKVKEHDIVISSPSQTVKDKGWMKNFAHIVGGGDPYLQSVIDGYMSNARNIIEDTSYGAHVYTFNKLSAAAIEQVNSGLLSSLFSEGLGMVTYFGHSSANSMEFNLDDPSIFNNPGKYPLFMANGCNAGNFFIYDTLRATAGKKNIAENYVLIPSKGSIGFIASTHYGIVNYLNLYTYLFYSHMAKQDYRSGIGDLQRNVMQEMLAVGGSDDFYNVMTAEQMLLGGDPAVKLYAFDQADYAIEDPYIKISPTPLSVTNANFDLKVKYFNLGKAVNDSVHVRIKRELPDGSLITLFDQNRAPVHYADSINLSVPINPYTDKGQNKIIVSLDPDDVNQEITNNNNNITKSFPILEDDVRPVYPLNFAIVNSNAIKLTATTNNFLAVPKNFIVEVDTTELFNSPLKVTQTQSSIGGVIDFTPTIPFRDSTVFYWRVAKVPDTGIVNKWSYSSFVYIPASSTGWNQSHYFQYLKDNFINYYFDSTRIEKFSIKKNDFRYFTGLYPVSLNYAYSNLTILTSGGCAESLGALEFYIINPENNLPLENIPRGSVGKFNSMTSFCNTTLMRKYLFWYKYDNPASRKYAYDLFDSVSVGATVVMSSFNLVTNSNPNLFINEWKKDTLIYGAGKSLYHRLRSIGFSGIDSFYRNIPILFVAKKTRNGWTVIEDKVGNSQTDILSTNFSYYGLESRGGYTTSIIGPSKSWTSIHWKGLSQELNSKDEINYKVFGVKNDFTETLMYSSTAKQKDTTLSFVSASTYPYLKIYQENTDTLNNTPWQTKYLQVKYQLVPEGAITPATNLVFKDTVEVGEPIKVNMAFKNVTPVPFDSIRLYMTSTDPSNNTKVIVDENKRPITAQGDTVLVNYNIDTKNLVGDNLVNITFNPNYTQPEQYLFNNFISKSIYVRPDTYAPNLDVTFDGVHILNKDIVSPKPVILVKLKDDSRFLALNDTSLFSVKLRMPNGQVRNIKFDSDTLLFTPSSLTPGGTDNTAMVTYKPYLPLDGEYELIVTGKDRSNNASGVFEYRVLFEVFNKSMITNLLNYPNPFTTSTSFVFTLTGSELPTNLRIQILTVSGKIVKEINKNELGPIRIGNNITEYKWDGTDQFGQPLANGVYIYRVITDINGKKLDKLRSSGFNTDKYFQGGYGKMYLMR